MALLFRRAALPVACLGFLCFAIVANPQQQQGPPASGARILLLPRQIVSGERATLAVLDWNGRLTPGVTVNFSNGDKFTTDASGRSLFVAPLAPGVMFGSIPGRPGKVATAILSPTEASSTSVAISSAPRFASLTNRFEILGKGFCGEADANHVTIGGLNSLVLASSPTALVVLPPLDLQAGSASVTVTCAKRQPAQLSVTFVALELQADDSPLKPDERRSLTVRVQGTTARVNLEAKNLASDIADLTGGNPFRTASSGGTDNVAKFEVVGRKNGNFLISIRLIPSMGKPR